MLSHWEDTHLCKQIQPKAAGDLSLKERHRWGAELGSLKLPICSWDKRRSFRVLVQHCSWARNRRGAMSALAQLMALLLSSEILVVLS